MIFQRLKNDEKGIAAVIAVLSVSFLFAIAALVIDIGNVEIIKAKLQNAADASALAAAQSLPDTVASTFTANSYMQKNGFEPSDIEIVYSDSNNKITVTASKVIEYRFAKIIGFNNVRVAQEAAAEKQRIRGPFDYALFSGSQTTPLSLNGSTFSITGSTHTNKDFTMNCTNATITGVCRAATSIGINGKTINVAQRYPNAPIVNMIEFSDTILTLAEQKGQVIYGDLTFNQTNLVINEAIYVYGNVNFNLSKFIGKGTICATGNINFNGSSLNLSTEDSVCFYSKNGNININTPSAELDGILYAPNGAVNINATSIKVNGRVIGKTLAINCSTLYVVAGTKELRSLPSASISLVK